MNDDLLKVAEQAALAARVVLLKHYGKVDQTQIEIKAKNDFVSFVDKEAEKAIVNTILSQFTDHTFLTEEGMAEQNGCGDVRWIIDPLDGTTNYLRMHHRFSVSIAAEIKGVLSAALVMDVMHNELFTALNGKGAFLDGKKIIVSETADLRNALVLFGTPFRQNSDIVNAFASLYGRVQNAVSDHRREGSAALDLVSVACGRAEAFYELQLKPWDVAAGQLIVKEAGGFCGDFFGANDNLYRETFLATNYKLQERFIALTSGFNKGA